MSHAVPPRTLVRMSGLDESPVDPSRSALLLIDAQREYTTGALPLVGVERAVEEAVRLLAFARAQQAQTQFEKKHSQASSSFYSGAAQRATLVRMEAA